MCPYLHIVRVHLPVQSKSNEWTRQEFEQSSIQLGRAAGVIQSFVLSETEELVRMKF